MIKENIEEMTIREIDQYVDSLVELVNVKNEKLQKIVEVIGRIELYYEKASDYAFDNWDSSDIKSTEKWAMEFGAHCAMIHLRKELVTVLKNPVSI